MIQICERCKRERQIYAKGLCLSCYVTLHKNKEKANLSSKKWRESHKEYFKEYYKNNREKLINRQKEYMKRKRDDAGDIQNP